jgi:hypothetical protein
MQPPPIGIEPDLGVPERELTRAREKKRYRPPSLSPGGWGR